MMQPSIKGVFEMGDVQDKRYGPMVHGRLRDQWRKRKSSWGTKSKVSMTKFSYLGGYAR